MSLKNQNFKQYLDKNDIFNKIIINLNNIQTGELIGYDTYDESKILERISKYDDESKTLLIKCTLQIAIIGFGNRTFGFIKHNDQILNIQDIFKKLNIVHNRNINEKYNDDTLTVRRLIRFFRYHIQEFIQKNNKPSYLFRKYSDRNLDFIHICFPGAEHLIDNENDANYLLRTYKKLDELQKTRFVDRLIRVYEARNIKYDIVNIK